MPRTIELVENKKLSKRITKIVPVASIATAALAVMAPSGSGNAYAHELAHNKKAPEALRTTNFLTWSTDINLVGGMVRVHVEDLDTRVLHRRPVPVHHPVKQRPLTPVQLAEKLITPEMEADEEKVHICEENDHGWHVDADIQAQDLSIQEKEVTYPGGEGMSEENWEQAGGNRFDPNEGDATEDEQKYVDYKWQQSFMHVIPDQDGCWHGGY
jgi:hypothetical protein